MKKIIKEADEKCGIVHIPIRPFFVYASYHEGKNTSQSCLTETSCDTIYLIAF